MATNFPSRADIDRAAPLDFDHRQGEKLANITIEISPAGLTVRCEYTGSIATIPAAIERLRQAGVVELVSAAAAQPSHAPSAKPKAERVEPLYKPDGTACCPVHKRALSEGAHGPFCSAKATGDQVADKKGYCGLRFDS